MISLDNPKILRYNKPMNIQDKLRAHCYTTKLPYGSRGSAERNAYVADQSRLEGEFHADLIEEYGTDVLPAEVESALYSIARENSGTHYETAGHYDELSTLVLLAFNAGIKAGR